MSSDKLTNQEIETFASVIKCVASLASTLTVEDAVRMLNQCGYEETVMPMIDPTRWMQTQSKTKWHRPLLEAFLDFRKAIEKIAESEGA